MCTNQTNSKYKDSVFTLLFSDKEKLIELYNAVEGTNYAKDTEVIINTLEDALYMNRINDISFVIDGKFVVLIEHQSTVNYNMPLRLLLYIARLYEKMIDNKAIYREMLIKIPTPEFIVLYNGKQEQPEEQILKLSEAFMEKADIKLELITKVININYGKSKVLDKSENLSGYSYFIYDVQKYKDEGMPLREAIKRAIQDCIKENILRKFLEENGSEVENMLFTEFDIDVAKEVWQEEAMRKGLERGLEQGLERGKQEGEHNKAVKIAKSLLDILDIETIAHKTGLTVQEVENLK